jgi:glutathione-regulated potassium-efflux system ancillary protein KefG
LYRDFSKPTMNRVLIVFTHPRFEKSRVNRALLVGAENLPGVTLNDLYEQYPDFNVDINREKRLLVDHQIIVWQHPLFMYSAPALLKQWLDLVLEFGWAHGTEGGHLAGKIVFNAVTAAGTRQGYTPGGHHRFSISQILVPYEQTAVRCKMVYLPPFVVHGTHRLTDAELGNHASAYRALLSRLCDEHFDVTSMQQFQYLNDWLLSSDPRGAAP